MISGKPKRSLTLLVSLLLIAGILAGVIAPQVTQAQTISDNPPLDPGCAQDIIIILDESLSIPNPGGGRPDATPAVRAAMTAAVEGLNGSGSYMAVVEFNLVGRRASIGGSIDYRPVNDAYVEDFKYYINNTANTNSNSGSAFSNTPGNNGFNPSADSAGTNWDHAFYQAQQIGERVSGRKPLIIFVTDGNPNFHYDPTNPNGLGRPNGTVSTAVAMSFAIPRANDIRDSGIKIFGVGFGDVAEATALQNLKDVSGPDDFNGSFDLLTDDFYADSNAEAMATALRRAFAGLCAPSLTIGKFVDGEPGGDGWEFSATVTIAEDGDYVWTNPDEGDAPPASTTQSVTTVGGIAQWEWTPGTLAVPINAPSTVEFDETPQSGYDFAGGTCIISTINVTTGVVTESDPIDIAPGDLPYTLPQLSINQYARCVIHNDTPAAPTGGVIGDFIWQDNDGDGIQDGGEPGIPGIIVQLTPPLDVDLGNGPGNPVTTTTGPDGSYEFNNVPEGNYTVTILNPPPGWTPTYDPDNGAPHTSEVTLGPGESNPDQDFGYQPPPGSIGDRIWRDDNGDGIQNPTEPGLAGITVRLTPPDDVNLGGGDGAPITTVTDAFGNYLFDGVPVGIGYVVEVVSPPPNNTGDPDGVFDSTATLDIASGEANMEQDFGYRPDAGLVGDTIFHDENGNGIQDPGEDGLPNINVTLWPPAGVNVGAGPGNPHTVPTDAFGNYLFTGVDPGDYVITVDNPPAGWFNSGDPDGGNNSTAAFTLGQGESNLNQDFGYQQPGKIGDTIWADLDGDGVQDPGEDGLPGIIVQLTPPPDVDLGAGPGNPVTTMTDPDGKYEFPDLPPGEYTVTVLNPPPGWPNTGDPDDGGDSTATVTLLPGQTRDDLDFGYDPPPGTIGDRIWRDDDGDGIQDPGEPGLPGITVELSDGTTTFTTVTDPFGFYQFNDVPPGTYTVTVLNPPPGWPNTGDPNDPPGTGDSTTTVTLPQDGVNLDQDFGYQPAPGLVGDTIWRDDNGNGIQDPDEDGLPGIIVQLTPPQDVDLGNGPGVPVTTMTGPDGSYLFTDVPPGDYVIEVLNPPAGWPNTGYPPGGGNSVSGFTLDVDNPSNLNQDFGYQPPVGTIGDRIWRDDDGDGVQDPGEPGVPGVIIQLTPPPDVDLGTGPGNPITTTTGPDGSYQFNDVPPGDYTIEVLNPPPGWPNTGYPPGGNPNINTLTFDPTTPNLDQDFGYQPPAGTIGDRIWRDDDGDGIQDPSEPGLPGIEVQLTPPPDVDLGNGPGNPITTTTDPYGNYQFNDVPPGEYTVTVLNPPPGWPNTGDPDGGAPNTAVVTLTEGEVNVDQDFGYRPSEGLVGDTIFVDYNGNGIQDPGEPGLPGIIVELTPPPGVDIGGGGPGLPITTTTDASGNYLFEDVPLGNYTIEVLNPPSGWFNTGDPDGGNNSRADFSLGEGDPFNLDQDFGYQPPGAVIGDRIWQDDNGDGIQDPGEDGLPGITVQLTPPPGVDIGGGPGLPITTTTGPNGNYLFVGLPPGEYTVTILNPPPGWPNTGDPDGGAPNTATVTVTEGEFNLDQDFGYSPNYLIITPSYLVTRVVEGQLTGEGSKACYWITLPMQPTGNVVISVDPNKLLKEVKIDKSQITLTPSNWNNLTTVNQSNFLCVRAVDDSVDEPEVPVCGDRSVDMTSDVSPYTNECGDHKEFVEHTVNPATTDPNYNASTPWVNRTLTHIGRPAENYLEAMVVDNDVAEVRITESFAITHLDESGSPVGKACYWLTLGSQPLNPVTISITPDGTEVTTDKSQVTLNAGNWNKLDASLADKTNMVCVTPINDNDIEPLEVNCGYSSNTMLGQPDLASEQICSTYMGSIGHTVSSSDPKYASAPFRNTNGPDFDGDQSTIDALIRNDDVARLVFQPATLNLLEGQQARFAVSLGSRPTADVIVTNDTTELVFQPATWNVPQEVTYEAQNNVVGLEPEKLFFEHRITSDDANYGVLAGSAIEVTIIPEGKAGVLISDTAIRVSEAGQTSTYDLALTLQPTADVEVALSTDGQLAVEPATLRFTADNWNRSQRVTVKAVDDRVAEEASHSGRITHTVSSTDSKYQSLSITDIVAVISDNDTAAVLADETSLVVSEDGSRQASYDVVLQSQPTASVVVKIDGGGQVTATPSMLIFTPANWNTAQAVLVQAIDDDVAEGLVHSTALTHKSESLDPFYNNGYEPSISVVIDDNDVAGVSLSKAVLTVSTGGTATYSVVLTSRPTSEVVIDLVAGDGIRATNANCTDDEGTHSCIYFTPNNWNVPQTVTVRADGAGRIDHQVVSADGIYSALKVNSVMVNSAFQLFMPVSRGD